MCSLCYPEDFFSGLHKVMGGHASRGPIPAGAFAVTWQKRGMKTEWERMVEKDK